VSPKIPYGGGCLCGAVRYRVAREPRTIYLCHCTDCQRSTGAAFGISLVVDRGAVTVEKGEPAPYGAQLADGRTKQGVMCASCGTKLWGRSTRTADFVILRPGPLDDRSWVKPVAHLWTRSAHPWFGFPQGATKFETQPNEAWKELFKLWEERSAH